MVDIVIVYVVILLLVLSVVLLLASRKESTSAKKARKEYGIPRGKVIYTDLNRPARPLFSRKFLIAGKPDYIVKDEQTNALIPVEVKSGNAKKPHWGHVLQLAAYCLLIEEAYSIRVPYGLLVYADGKQHQIKFDDALRSKVISMADEMRRCLKKSGVTKGNRFERRCLSCSVRGDCSQAKGS
jgi:CRISPR-associated exonuclease Cas4